MTTLTFAASQLKTTIYHVHGTNKWVCVHVAHCCTGCRAAGHPVALAQQDSVYVDVVISVCVTQVELQHISNVTIQSAHQGAIRAQLLERSRRLRSPATLQEDDHNTLKTKNTTVPEYFITQSSWRFLFNCIQYAKARMWAAASSKMKVQNSFSTYLFKNIVLHHCLVLLLILKGTAGQEERKIIQYWCWWVLQAKDKYTIYTRWTISQIMTHEGT